METTLTKNSVVTETEIFCHHCGDKCEEVLKSFGHDFCCQGCVTVYDILSSNGMEKYYSLEKNLPITPDENGNVKLPELKKGAWQIYLMWEDQKQQEYQMQWNIFK